jgi:hypothetical protein
MEGYMATRSRMIVRHILIITIVVFMSACAHHKPVQKEEPPPGTYLEKIYTTPNTKTDLEMFREAMPPYIDFLSNSLNPKVDDDKLLCRVAGVYYGYAYCLVEDRNRKDASELYLKGRDLALRELKYYRIFNQALAYKLSVDAFRKALDESFTKAKAPVIYWAAMNWGAWICINLNKPDAMEDIPKVQAMLEFVNSCDDSYENGSVHAMLGALYAVQPKMEGGDPARAKEEFEKAFSCSFSSTLTYQVMYARYYAYPMKDRALFEGTLQSVLDKPANYFSDMNFVNEVAKKRAGILLKNVDKYFKPSKTTAVKKVATKKPAAQGTAGKPAAAAAPLVPAVEQGVNPRPAEGAAPLGAAVQETPPQPAAGTAPGTGAQETPPAAQVAPQNTGTPEASQPPAVQEASPQPAVQEAPQSIAAPEASQMPSAEAASPSAGAQVTPQNTGTPEASQTPAVQEASPSTGTQETPPQPAVQEAPQNTPAPEASQQPSAESTPPSTAAQEAPQSASAPEASQTPTVQETPQSTQAAPQEPAVQQAPQQPSAQEAPQSPDAQSTQKPEGSEQPLMPLE